MRPFKARFRIRGTFSRTRAGERFPGRGRGLPNEDNENPGREGRPPRSHPLFYPADRDEAFSSSLYDDLEDPRHGNPMDERYDDRREHGRDDYSRRFDSRSRSPSPFDKFQDERRRSGYRSRSRSPSRSRSQSRSRSLSRSKRGRSSSRSPQRRRSPSYSPRRRSEKNRFRSRSRTPDSYRKDLRENNPSTMPDFRESRRVEKSERTVDTVQSISNSPERSIRVTVGNFKRDDRPYKSMKSPTEDMYLDRKHSDEKLSYRDSPKHGDHSPRRGTSPPKHEHDQLRYGRMSPRRESDILKHGDLSPRHSRGSPRHEHGNLVRHDHDSPRRDILESPPWSSTVGSSDILKRHSDPKDIFKESIMKDRFNFRDEFSKDSEFHRGRLLKGSSRSPSPSHSRISKSKGIKSPPWYDSPSRSHDSLLDIKPVKSILKKKMLPDEESDSRSSIIGIPGLSVDRSSFSSTTIPGLGDVDAIEDEEKYLYGDESDENFPKNSSTAYRKEVESSNYLQNIDDGSRSPLPREALRNKHKEYPFERKDDEYRNYRESPLRNLRSSSPSMRREVSSFKDHYEFSNSPERPHSPHHSHKMEMHLGEDLSPRLAETLSRSHYLLRKRKASDDSDFSDYFRNKDKHIDKDPVKGGNRKLEDVLKSMGFDFDMVRKFQEGHSSSDFADINSPMKDTAKEALDLYGIKPEMQTSSFFETSSKSLQKRESLTLQSNKLPSELETSSSLVHQQYATTPTQQINPYLSVGNEPQYSHQLSGAYAQFSYPTGPPSSDPYSYPPHYMMNPSYSSANLPPTQVDAYAENPARSNLKVIPLQTNVSSSASVLRPVIATATATSNLRQVPLTSTSSEEKPSVMSNVQKMLSNVLKLSLKPQVSSTVQEKETDELVKSVKDVQFLLNRREKQYKKLELLEKELCQLAKQQGELMRKKQKQKDGHKDPLLLENNKLQEEISQEINQTRLIIEETTDLLKGSDFFLKARPVKEDKPQKVPKPSSPVPQPAPVEKAVPEENETEYEYTDSGNHWCKICNEFLPNLSKWFAHLQSKEHYKNIDPSDLVVLSDAFKPPKQTVKQSQKRLISSIKGVQFLLPSSSFFCKLCSEFLGNNASAEYHLKSKEHNFKYLKFVLENPMYERKWNADKITSLSVKAEEVKRKRVEQDREREERRKRRLVEAEMRNKELIKAEAARNKHVGELDETPKVSSASKPDSSKGKEIKLTLKMEKHSKENRNRDAYSNKEDSGFGKFTWKKDTEKKEETPPKVEEKEPAVANTSTASQKPGSRIAIRLSGKTMIPPSIPWQTISKGGALNSKMAKQNLKTSVTSFPLRKGKNDPLSDKNSSMDIFSSVDQSSGKNRNTSPRNEGKAGTGFAPSQMDIAKAFVGKFETTEESNFLKHLKSENNKNVATDQNGAAKADHSPIVDSSSSKNSLDVSQLELQKNVGEFDKIPLSSSSFISTFVNNDKVSPDNNSILSVNNQKKEIPQATTQFRPTKTKVKEDTMAAHDSTTAGKSSSIPSPPSQAIFYGPQLPTNADFKNDDNLNPVIQKFESNVIEQSSQSSSQNIRNNAQTSVSITTNKIPACDAISLSVPSQKEASTVPKVTLVLNSSKNAVTDLPSKVTTSNSTITEIGPLNSYSDGAQKEVHSDQTVTMNIADKTGLASSKSSQNSLSVSTASGDAKSNSKIKASDVKKYIPKGPSNVVCDYIMKSLANSTLKSFSDKKKDLPENVEVKTCIDNSSKISVSDSVEKLKKENEDQKIDAVKPNSQLSSQNETTEKTEGHVEINEKQVKSEIGEKSILIGAIEEESNNNIPVAQSDSEIAMKTETNAVFVTDKKEDEELKEISSENNTLSTTTHDSHKSNEAENLNNNNKCSKEENVKDAGQVNENSFKISVEEVTEKSEDIPSGICMSDKTEKGVVTTEETHSSDCLSECIHTVSLQGIASQAKGILEVPMSKLGENDKDGFGLFSSKSNEETSETCLIQKDTDLGNATHDSLEKSAMNESMKSTLEGNVETLESVVKENFSSEIASHETNSNMPLHADASDINIMEHSVAVDITSKKDTFEHDISTTTNVDEQLVLQQESDVNGSCKKNECQSDSEIAMKTETNAVFVTDKKEDEELKEISSKNNTLSITTHDYHKSNEAENLNNNNNKCSKEENVKDAVQEINKKENISTAGHGIKEKEKCDVLVTSKDDDKMCYEITESLMETVSEKLALNKPINTEVHEEQENNGQIIREINDNQSLIDTNVNDGETSCSVMNIEGNNHPELSHELDEMKEIVPALETRSSKIVASEDTCKHMEEEDNQHNTELVHTEKEHKEVNESSGANELSNINDVSGMVLGSLIEESKGIEANEEIKRNDGVNDANKQPCSSGTLPETDENRFDKINDQAEEKSSQKNNELVNADKESAETAEKSTEDDKNSLIEKMEEDPIGKPDDSQNVEIETSRLENTPEETKAGLEKSEKDDPMDKTITENSNKDGDTEPMLENDDENTSVKDVASDADSDESGMSEDLQIGSDMIVLDETLFDTE